MSPRLLLWGVVGGIAGAVAVAVGHVTFFSAGDVRVAAITAAWLNLFGTAALVFAVVGLHEPLRLERVGLAGPGAAVSLVGLVLVAGVLALELGRAYGAVPGAALGAPAMAGYAAFAVVVLLLGLLALAGAMLRSEVLSSTVAVLLVLAVVASALGFLASAGRLVGSLLLAAAFGGAARELSRVRGRLVEAARADADDEH